MNDLALIAQWILGLVFLVSAVGKLADRSGTADAVVGFGVPERLRWAAPIIPGFELVLAVALVVPATAHFGAFGAVGLLLVFSAAIVVNLARGRRPDCNCFGQLTKGPIGAGTLVRNGLLLVLAGVAAQPDPSSPGDLLSGISVPVALGVIAAVVIAGVLVALVWLVLELWRQQARLLERLDALETGATFGAAPTPAAVGPPIDAPAPDAHGIDAAGSATTLSRQWSAGRTTLVVFGDPNCRACSELQPDLASWLERDRDRRHLVVVSPASGIDAPDGAAVFVEQERSASVAYGVRGTPSAVFVDGSGTVASALAEGADAIRSLLASTPAASNSTRDAGANGSGSAPVRFRPRPVRAGDVLAEDVLRSDAVLDESSDAPTLLLFWNERCTHCRAMDDTLTDRSTRDAADGGTGPVQVAFVVPSEEQASSVAARIPGAQTVVDHDMRTNMALGVPGTPSAALIGSDRRLLADLAIGPDAVSALLDSATRGSEEGVTATG